MSVKLAWRRVCPGPNPECEEWLWAAIEPEKWGSEDSVNCVKVYLTDTELYRLSQYLIETNCLTFLRKVADSWSVWDDGAVLEVLEPTVIEVGNAKSVTVYEVGHLGMFWCLLEKPNFEIALSCLMGNCRELPGMNVASLDWWMSYFGCEALISFYNSCVDSGRETAVETMKLLLLSVATV